MSELRVMASPNVESTPQRSDDDLMLLVRGGVDAAFDTLIQRHRRAALAVAHRHAGDLQLVEDVVQEAFVEVYRARARYRPEGKFRPFLLRIVLQRSRMARRKARRMRLVFGTVPEVAVASTIEAEVLAQQRQREIQITVNKLSEHHRAVIALRFGADMTHAQLAETLKIPEGTARSRLFHALKSLRTKLQGMTYE